MAFNLANKIARNIVKNFSKTFYCTPLKPKFVTSRRTGNELKDVMEESELPSTSHGFRGASLNESRDDGQYNKNRTLRKRSSYRFTRSRKNLRKCTFCQSRNYSSTSCKKMTKCSRCPPPCAPPRCPKYIMPGCIPPKTIRCDLYTYKPCKKVMAPYPAYSEFCHTILDEKPTECKLCPWKPHDHPTYKIVKRRYHTSNTNFLKWQEEMDKKNPKTHINLGTSNATLLKNLKQSLKRKMSTGACHCASKGEHNRPEKKIPRCGTEDDDDPCKLKRKGTVRECPTDLLVKKRRKPPKPIQKI